MKSKTICDLISLCVHLIAIEDACTTTYKLCQLDEFLGTHPDVPEAVTEHWRTIMLSFDNA